VEAHIVETSAVALRFGTGIFAMLVLGAHSISAQTRTSDGPVKLPVIDKQDIRFVPLSVGGERFQKRVHALAQDNYGFVWLGTDDGLYRYDGYTLKAYRHDPNNSHSLSDNTVFVVYKDRAGILWIGTYGGLDRYDPAQDDFTLYVHDPADNRSLRSGLIWSIYRDGAGALWIGTSEGLDRLDVASGRFFHYPPPSAKPDAYAIWGLYEDGQGNFLVGCAQGLYKLERSTGRFSLFLYPVSNPFVDREVEWFELDRSGEVWFTTPSDSRFGALNPKTGESKRYAFNWEELGSRHSATMSRFHKDRNGVIWIGTVADGLLKFDQEGKNLIRYAPGPDKGISGQIWALLEDSEGNIWVGSDSGVSRFQPAALQFANYQYDSRDPKGSRDNKVWSVHADKQGFLWTGTERGLQRLDRKTGQVVLYEHDPGDPRSLSDNAVSAIEEDRSGALWIGTHGGGLNRFDRVSGRFFAYRHNPKDPQSLSDDYILSLLAEPGGVVWVGTASGLNRFDPVTGHFRAWRNDPRNPGGLSYDDVRVIRTDRAGKLWLGTLRGLDRFDPDTERFTVYLHDNRDPASLSNESINSIYRDHQGTLWIGTRRGLNRLDQGRGTFESFTTRDGLADDDIEAIREDSRGNLWLATHKGLSEFRPQTKAVRNYSEADGLPGTYQGPDETGERSCVTPDGELVFGSDHGVTEFDPDRVSTNLFRPPVVLTDFLLFNQPVVPSGKSPLHQPIWATHALALNYDQSIFTVGFAALSYVAPERNRYRYKLEGLEKGWNEVGEERRSATYTNLPAGKYTFQVQGSNNDGVWNSKGVSLAITVLPPWWATWWFRSILSLTIAALVFGAYRARIRQLNLRFEDRLAERTHIAQELHDTLIQDMVAFGLQLDIIEDQMDGEPGAAKSTLDVVRDRVREAISRGRHALLDLRSSTATTNDLIESLSRAGTDLSTGEVPRFSAFVQGNQCPLHSLIWHELDRIGREAITNAFRHAGAGSIEAGLFCSDHAIRLVVRDDGCGMTTRLVSKGRPGHFGLHGMRERAERAGGRLTVRSRHGGGTEVSVTIPLRRPRKTRALLTRVVGMQSFSRGMEPPGSHENYENLTEPNTDHRSR
jgi:ligand-binding sensor domain-containing protein/signal transduction histidine kinase